VVAAAGARLGAQPDSSAATAIHDDEPVVVALADPPGAAASVPLHIAEQVAGALTAFVDGARGVDEPEISLLEGLVEDIGRAIEAVRMRILLAESAMRTNTAAGRIETLWRLSGDRCADIEEQVVAVLAEGTRTLGLEFGILERIEGTRIEYEFASGPAPIRSPGAGTALAGTVTELVHRHGRTLSYSDGARLSDPTLSESARDFGVRSALAAPVPFDDRRYALFFGSTALRPRPFTGEDHTYAELLAALLGRLLEQRRRQEELAALIATDPTTGLSNRAHFVRLVDDAVGRPDNGAVGVSVLLVEVDHFEDLGLTFGRQEHDRMMRTFADRMRGIVGENARVAYLGIGAFAVAVQGTPERGEQLARVLGEAIALPLHVEGREVRCSASIGVALHPRDASNAETLLAAADAAVVRAQQEGGAGTRFFNEGIGEALRLRRTLLQGLRHAGQREEFELHYQPVVDLLDNRISMVEALLRWRDPKYGLRLPADFIETAEESEAVLPIDEWVMREAVHRSQVLLCGARRLRLAFNISGSAVVHPGTLPLLAAIIRDEGADPATLQLEISERVASRDLAAVRRLVDGCRELGLSVSLDDFGTGFASLLLIKQLSVDTLKIDGSFVRDLPQSPEDAAIVRATIALGRSLGRRIVAEGVEREEAARWLAVEGCQAAQGYWFAAPLPQEEFLSWLSMHE
ncbi:MAG: EAL domain-containing protein, partial [bacterium]|nr:EAL domain-containing protein [bacterium]